MEVQGESMSEAKNDYMLELAKKTIDNGILEASIIMESSSEDAIKMIEEGATILLEPLQGRPMMIREALGPWFMKAAEAGKPDVLVKLLEMGAHPNWKNEEGLTALQQILEVGNTDAVMDLIAGISYSQFTLSEVVDHKIHIRNKHKSSTISSSLAGGTALHMAVKRRNSSCVVDLLEVGADAGATTDKGETALMIAIKQHEHLPTMNPSAIEGTKKSNKVVMDIIDALIDYDCPITKRNHEGRTALSMAAEGGKTEIFELLVRSLPLKQSKPDANDLQLCLAVAIKSDNHEIMKLAVEAGANPCGKLGEYHMKDYINRGLNFSDRSRITQDLLNSLQAQHTITHDIIDTPHPADDESVSQPKKSQLSL